MVIIFSEKLNKNFFWFYEPLALFPGLVRILNTKEGQLPATR